MWRLLGHSGPVFKLVTAMEMLSTSLSQGMEKAFTYRKITPLILLSPKSKKQPVFEYVVKCASSPAHCVLIIKLFV